MFSNKPNTKQESESCALLQNGRSSSSPMRMVAKRQSENPKHYKVARPH